MFARTTSALPGDDGADVFAPVADLMVAVVFVILLLVLTLSLQLDPTGAVPRREHDRVVAELTAARGQLVERNAEAVRLSAVVRFVRDGRIVPVMDRMARAEEVRSDILGELRQRLREAGVDVAVDPKAGTLALPAGSLFASGRSEPSAEGRDTILKLGRALTEVLPCYAGGADNACSPASAGSISAVYIEGHTDMQSFGQVGGQVGGRFRNNWDLSAGRAIEAFTLLRASFDKLRDLRNPSGQALVGVSGYADTRPAGDAADRTGTTAMERDRRIEVRLLMSNDAQLAGSVLRELREQLDAVQGILRE